MTTQKKKNKERMLELIDILTKASESYYQKNKEEMSNFAYDALYDELVEIEEALNIQYSNSPTNRVGYEIVSKLEKQQHESPMLSLDKTKSREELVDFLGEEEGILSVKLDGLTIVLTYENGELVNGVTRGNGEIGEVITGNVKTFANLPLKIKAKERIVIRGEAIITYTEFEKINEELPLEEQYKNPRNLCSGTVRQLNSEITKKRNVRFLGFSLVSGADHLGFTKKSEELNYIEELGIETAEYYMVEHKNIIETIERFSTSVATSDIGSDGLVLTYDNKAYSESLGTTSKFPKDSIAFKWQDEIKETILQEILWSPSRTGLINPVAIFEEVDLEGTIVKRASLHNVSMVEKLKLGIGDIIKVYKANMIIPQVAENVTKSGTCKPVKECPACGEPTEVKNVNDVKVLMCNNKKCAAKQVKSFSHFVSRNAMNVEGLSEATIIRLIEQGLLHNFGDIFSLEEHKEMMINIEGFGEKSYENLIASIEKAKKVDLANFIYALGIQHVGLSNAKLLVRQYKGDFDKILEASVEELITIDGYGEKIALALVTYFTDEEKRKVIDILRNKITFHEVKQEEGQLTLDGLNFVITGSVHLHKNREEIKEVIEKNGGKATGSVSKNTNYLINNDKASSSSKNKKAKELGIPILSEEEFLALL